MKVRFLLATLVLLAACDGPHLPPRWTLSGNGVSVDVERSPFQYTVKDGTGKSVLTSLGKGAHDGYGTVGWTKGNLIWDHVVSPGYFTTDAELEPWRDDWTVASATQPSPTQLELTLSTGGEARRIHLVLTLRDSTFRAEASLDGTGDAPRAWSAGFLTPPDEAFLGFGERFNRLDQRGLTLYSWAEEGGLGKSEATPKSAVNPWPNGETMTYYPVPFFLSTQGYGFWLDSTWRNEFRLASDRSDGWRVWTTGPSLAFEVYLPIPADARPWPQQAVDLFTQRTGRPMVPPAWTLGPRRRMNRNAMVGGKLEIQAMRDAGLAVTTLDDALHFLPAGSDLGDQANIAAWTAVAQKLGYHSVAYYNPYISKDPSPLDADAQTGLANRWFLSDATGAPSVVWLISGKFLSLYTVDVTSADATRWFTAMFQRAFDLGYSGWMYDFGEYVQPEVKASNGMTGEELHNLFPVLYQKAAHDALEAGPHKGDWLTFVRSGYTGASQWSPMVWSGDPDASFDDGLGLPAMVRAGVNLGMSGVPGWGSDIGGYKCGGSGATAADGELLARWIEFGSMGTDMHDEDSCAAPSDSGTKATIWTSTDAQKAWSSYARLHTRLFPYLYSLALQANATGAPSMRAMFFEHPTTAFAAVDDQYYVGPALLAAPVVKRGARTRDVQLPPGRYLEWPEGILRAGPGTITVDAPLDKLPLFLRDGYLVPLLDASIDTLTDGAHPGIVGPADVAQVYDVVGLISSDDPSPAKITLAGGGVLSATLSGGFTPPSLAAAASEADLATCAPGCWRAEPASLGVQRVRISASTDVTAGGLSLSASTGRRTRWDLYLVQP